MAGWAVASALVSCGGSAPAPKSSAAAEPVPASMAVELVAPAAAPASTPAPAVAKTRDLPGTCPDKANCSLPDAFVEAVCKKKFPDLPLYLFAARQPWQHRYVKAEHVEPVNVYGGEQSEAWMMFGEELLILRRRAPGADKGPRISGPTDVDVLRWDGTCATIRDEMLVSYVPAPMKSPLIIWKYLSADLQQALLENAVVARSREAEKKGCRDSSPKHPTPACEKAMRQLTDAIALAVHTNIALPTTGVVPEWAP